MITKAFLLKPILFVVAAFALAPVRAQPRAYVGVSSGLVTFRTSVFGNAGSHTKRRDAISAGFGLSDLVALEVSYFQIQAASGSDSVLAPGASHTVDGRDKLSGWSFGPVFRWRLTEGITIFTRQSAVSVSDDYTSVTRWTSPSEVTTFSSSKTFWGYQPSVGLDFRLTSQAPVSLGVELHHVFTTSERVKDLTGFLVNLSYGF